MTPSRTRISSILIMLMWMAILAAQESPASRLQQGCDEGNANSCTELGKEASRRLDRLAPDLDDGRAVEHRQFAGHRYRGLSTQTAGSATASSAVEPLSGTFG